MCCWQVVRTYFRAVGTRDLAFARSAHKSVHSTGKRIPSPAPIQAWRTALKILGDQDDRTKKYGFAYATPGYRGNLLHSLEVIPAMSPKNSVPAMSARLSPTFCGDGGGGYSNALELYITSQNLRRSEPDASRSVDAHENNEKNRITFVSMSQLIQKLQGT